MDGGPCRRPSAEGKKRQSPAICTESLLSLFSWSVLPPLLCFGYRRQTGSCAMLTEFQLSVLLCLLRFGIIGCGATRKSIVAVATNYPTIVCLSNDRWTTELPRVGGTRAGRDTKRTRNRDCGVGLRNRIGLLKIKNTVQAQFSL